MSLRSPSRVAFVLVGLLLVASPLAAQAPSGPVVARSAPIVTPKPGVGFLIEGGVEFGGAELIELTFTNGDTQTLTAGQGGTIAAGLQYRPARLPRLSLAGTAGYKFVTNASEDADIKITRVPLEFTGRWMLSTDWSVGAGLVTHASAKVDGDGYIPDVEFESSIGPTFELAWRWFAVTYTAIDYTYAGESINAGSVGFMARWVSRAK